jgi:hypothetical protein
VTGNGARKPITLQDAVDIIRVSFPEEELQVWATESESSANALAHFVLGTWIRNNWVHGAGSPLAVRIKEAYWFIQADEVSSMVIRALWRVLNGLPCPSIEALLSPAQLRFGQLFRERMNGKIVDTRWV